MDLGMGFDNFDMDDVSFIPSTGIFGFSESSLDAYFDSMTGPSGSSIEATNHLYDSDNSEPLISKDAVKQLEAVAYSDIAPAGNNDGTISGETPLEKQNEAENYSVDSLASNTGPIDLQAAQGPNEFDKIFAEMGITTPTMAGMADSVNSLTDAGFGHAQVSSESGCAASQDPAGYNLSEDTNNSLAPFDNFPTPEEVDLAIANIASSTPVELGLGSSISAAETQTANNQTPDLIENNPVSSSTSAQDTTTAESSAPTDNTPPEPAQPNENPQADTAMSSQAIKDEQVTPQYSDDVDDDLVLKFSSVEQANEHPKRASVPEDPTIPKTTEEKKAIVKELIRAMRDTDSAEDNPQMIKPFREGKHSTERMEVVCWNLLDACISRHLSGPLLAGYGPKHNRTSSSASTFRERKDDIVECLTTHKTICKHLLDPFYLYNFVDDPRGARQRVRSNKTLNQRKTDVMNAGKQALGKESTPKPTATTKKSTRKPARDSEEKDIPSPFPTPGNAPAAVAQPSTPVANTNTQPTGYMTSTQPTNAVDMTPVVSSPLQQDMTSSMSGSADSSVFNSPTPANSFPSTMMDNMSSLNALPCNLQFGGNSTYPTITYPTTTTGRVTNFSPLKPSGLQNVYHQNATMPDAQFPFPGASMAPNQMNIPSFGFFPTPPHDFNQQPSGYSVSQAYGHGPTKRRYNDEGSDATGSPQKRARH